MKRKALALAVLMSTALLCSCAQGNASDYAQENMSAVIGASMNNYLAASRRTSANSKAHYIKNQIDTNITYADAKGYGIKSDGSCIISATITDGVCNAILSAPDSFEHTDSISWYNDDIGGSAGDNKETDNALTMLEIDLADCLSDVESGYIGAYLENGRVQFVYFTEEATQPVPEMEAVLTDRAARDSFAWASGTNGVSQEGYIVGTAPELGY